MAVTFPRSLPVTVDLPPRPVATGTDVRRSAVRTDIQALRAIAVSLVVTYHLWPTRLTGGFVGVDVFFVISGFLITSHLLSHPPRRPRDLAEFWGRRIRRLLPASLTVLAVSLVVTRLWGPETLWATTARQVRSAALYVVNWRLASDAVDYSAAESAATAVQHFWSLSVEEQFYLGWPVLIAVVMVIAAVGRRFALGLVRLSLVLVCTVSLALAIGWTVLDPAKAYFVTPTRIWELGAGGLLAAATIRPLGSLSPTAAAPPSGAGTICPAARAALVWAGLAAVVLAALTFDAATPFPGWHALLPVLGTVAVIAAADPRGPLCPGRVLALRPVQWLGDVSYSVYLWHWPLIIALPFVSGTLGVLDRLVIIVVTLVLAALTKRWVEDRFRTVGGSHPLLRTYAFAALGMALVVSLAGLQLSEVDHRERVQAGRVAAALNAGPTPCFGAAALEPGAACDPIPFDALVPGPTTAQHDRYDRDSQLFGKKCWAARPDFATKNCEFGAASAPVRVAVVGNSHAAQWIAALQTIASERQWQLTSYFAQNCALATTPQDFESPALSAGCRQWVARTTEDIAAGDYDLVVLSNRISVAPAGETTITSRPAFADGYTEVLQRWSDAGVRVLGIADTPFPGASVGNVPECLAAHAKDFATACSGPRSTWVPGDPLQTAAERVADPHVRVADLNDHICPQQTCAPVVGGVLAYSDHSHLTATFVSTMTPYLDREVGRALAAR